MYREDANGDQSILVVGVHGSVLGLDRETGKEIWRSTLPSGYGTVDMAIHGTAVLVAAEDNTVVCLSYATGETLWTATTEGWGRATILVHAGRIYVGRSGVVECFSIEGQKLWSQGPPDLEGGVVSLGFPGNVRQADSRRS